MSNYEKDNTPTFFLNAKVYPYKSDASRFYVWSKTVNLSDVIKELGTDIVTVKMIKTTKADADPDERVFIFKGSDPKYLPKGERGSGKGSSSKPAGVNTSYSDDEDIKL